MRLSIPIEGNRALQSGLLLHLLEIASRSNESNEL